MKKTKRKEEFMKLNLGCGADIKEGFLNVDLKPIDKKVMKIDLEKPLPFEDNTFESIVCNYILEHIINYEPFIDEIWRICKPNAIIEIKVGHHSFSGTKSVLCSRRSTYNEFQIYTQKRQVWQHYPLYFEILERQLVFSGGLNPLNYIGKIIAKSDYLCRMYEETFIHNIILAESLYFKLKVLK